MTTKLWNPKYDTKGLVIKSKVDKANDVVLEPRDFYFARKLYDAESVDSNDSMQLFRALVYCLFTSSDSYENQLYVLNNLLIHEMITPQKLLEKKEKLDILLKRIIYNNSKKRHLVSLCEDWWPSYKGLQFAINYAKQYNTGGKNIREIVSESCPGLGRKCSSLYVRMNGFVDCVPLDRWALRFLKFTAGVNIDNSLDHRIHNGKRNNVRGPNKSQYLKYEEKFSEFAKEYDFSPAALQMMLYRKTTKWTDETPSPLQINLFDTKYVSFLHLK